MQISPERPSVIEEAALVLPEESVTTGPKRSKTKDVPVRLLRSFSVYDMDSKRLVPCDTWREDANYEASGLVEVWYGDDQWDSEDEEDDEEGGAIVHHGIPTNQKVRLSRILEFNVHHVEDESEGSFKLDECAHDFSRIYLSDSFPQEDIHRHRTCVVHTRQPRS